MSSISRTTGRVAMAARLSTSTLVWFGVLACLLLTKLVLTLFFPNAFADPDQAALFDWIPLAIFWVVGLAGVLLANRTGFPAAWGGELSNRNRVIFPIVAGLLFGVLYVVFDLLTHFTVPIVARHGVGQQYTGFLPIFLAFSAASVLVEIIYRLLLVPLLLFLISNLLLRGRAQDTVFWVLAVLSSALEPLTMAADLAVLPPPLMALHALGLYALNFTQVSFFRRFGYLSAILVRVAYYLVWHALYVH